MQKVRSAVGLENGKPISENETMGPAGHMQGRSVALQLFPCQRVLYRAIGCISCLEAPLMDSDCTSDKTYG